MNRLTRLDDLVGTALPVSLRRAHCRDPGAGGGNALSGSVILGMPHLSANGLSETWLLKDLGHRHWIQLANAAGMSVPDFRDERGDPIYAAFCAISVAGAEFARVAENDVLEIVSGIARISRTQFGSRHTLSIGGQTIGVVDMVSTFVRRGAGESNHAVARVAIGDVPLAAGLQPIHDLATTAAAVRGGRIDLHRGFSLAPAPVLAEMTFDPCPSQDFNGAGFLYFSSFLSFVDRAEWEVCRAAARTATTRRRDVFFMGNLDPGDRLTVAMTSWRETEDGFAHHCRLTRNSDSAVIAEVVTFRSAR